MDDKLRQFDINMVNTKLYQAYEKLRELEHLDIPKKDLVDMLAKTNVVLNQLLKQFNK